MRPPVVALEAAREAARRGWAVFPLVAGRKTPRKALTDWETKATSDPARIGRWWARHPGDNIGIATGPSGLVVVDLDIPKPDAEPPPEWVDVAGGVEVLDQVAAQHGHELAPTWTVATSSGGRHRYYQAPPGRVLRNTAGRLGWCIDTRAHGGYVVGAGSLVDAHPYSVTDPTDLIVLPGWLADLLDPPASPAPPRQVRPPSRARGYVGAALAGEVQAVLEAGPRRRNKALHLAAWSLGRFVAAGVLPRHVVESALQSAAEAAGYAAGPRSAAGVIRSSLNARLHRNPHGGPRP